MRTRTDVQLKEESLILLACGRTQKQKSFRLYGGFQFEAAAIPMSIWSWNCQGAGSSETVQRLRNIRRKYFPDLFFLMETKQKFKFMDDLRLELGYDKMVTVEPIGRSGGLALLWKQSYDVEVLSSSNRIIDIRVRLGSLVFYISCVYGDPIKENRRFVWDDLVSIGVTRNEPWLLLGDFNELMSNAEKEGGAIRHESTFWDFRNLAISCKIKETRSSGNSLSWAGWREMVNGAGRKDKVWVQCRLDRSFGNDSWFQLFSRSKTEYMRMYASDHRPIKLSFALEPDDRSYGRFYFDQRMIRKEGFEDAVIRGWNVSNLSGENHIMNRIANCRKELARWKRGSNLNAQSNIERLSRAN